MKIDAIWTRLALKLQQEDKVKHMTWSFWLMLAGLFLLPVALAMLAVFLIGLAKEIWDERYGSGFCFYDMAGNCIGMSAALLIGLPLHWALTL